VVDDQNNMLGIVTMEDVIEILLGMDIADESDTAHGIRAVAREHWKRRAIKAGIIVDQTNPSIFPEVSDQEQEADAQAMDSEE
jgi:CBS domain containing-hemolysin-like protein